MAINQNKGGQKHNNKANQLNNWEKNENSIECSSYNFKYPYK